MTSSPLYSLIELSFLSLYVSDFICISLPMTLMWLPPNRKMLKLCGETEDKLAQELLQFELQTEREVVEPLYVLAEVGKHCPN